MATTNKLSDYYAVGSRIEINDEDCYYSRFELAATMLLFSDSGEFPGIQTRIYSGFRNSLMANEFVEYPADTFVRISSLSDEYGAKLFDASGDGKTEYNISGLNRILSGLDKTTSKEFKVFAGYDGKRWDFIADMGGKKAVLYIKSSIEPAIIQNYLAPFVPSDIKKRHISRLIRKIHKKGGG